VTIVAERYIAAENLSEAWLDVVRFMSAVPGRKAVHLLVRISDPQIEDLPIRSEAEELIEAWNRAHPKKQMQAIETTRNTMFPAAFARRTAGPADLARYYRERYGKDGLRGFELNERGIYFGRLVAYPRSESEYADQLSDTVRKLQQELNTGSNKSSRYELNVYNERLDRSPMSFPCLAHLSVHLHERKLHVQAIYRNEYLVARAYGNYLGLSQLQAYIADSVNVAPGELLVTAGHIEMDGSRSAVLAMLKRLEGRGT